MQRSAGVKFCQAFDGGFCPEVGASVPRSWCLKRCRLAGIKPVKLNEPTQRQKCEVCEYFKKGNCKSGGDVCLLMRYVHFERWIGEIGACPKDYPGKKLDEIMMESVKNKTAIDAIDFDAMEVRRRTNPALFFNAARQRMPIENSFSGQTAFLVCGGPSLTDTMWFEYYNYMLSQPGIFSMAINNVGNFVRTNMWICSDNPGRFSPSIWMDPRVLKITPISRVKENLWDNQTKQMLTLTPEKCPNVVYYRPHTWASFKVRDWFQLNQLCFGWQEGKGLRTTFLSALNALYYLGFSTVYLIGADFSMSKQKKYAFDENRSEQSIRINNGIFKMCNEVLSQWRPCFEHVGFHVYNCTKDSGLKVFEFADFETAIAKYRLTPQDSCKGYYINAVSKLPEDTYKFVGPLGDSLCALPAIAELVKAGRKIKLSSRNIHAAQILEKSGLFDGMVDTDARKVPEKDCLDLRWRFANGLGVSLSSTDIPRLDIAAQRPDGLAEGDYICLCNGASGSKRAVREVDIQRWNELAVALSAMGYQTVQLGTEGAEPIDGVTLNRVGKTSLMDCGKILAGARLLVSVDTGLFHFAHAVRCPQVVLFTVADKKHRVYSDTEGVQLDACSTCRKKHVKPEHCPRGDYACGQFTTEQMIDAVRIVLNDRKEKAG